MEKRPNILWFVADQMRCDSLHHMGNEASMTPNLDKITEEGVSFEHAYCQNPVCVPSRCSFLSGLYPHTTGHRTMHFLQNPDEPNILKTMKQQGYEVVWIGRNDLVSGERDKSEYCDYYFDGIKPEDQSRATMLSMKGDRIPYETPELMQPEEKYSFYQGKYDAELAHKGQDWGCIDSLIRYLEKRQQKNEAERKPFFIYCTLFFPHPPYGCEDPWFSAIDRNGLMPRRKNIWDIEHKPSMLYGIGSKQGLQNWPEEKFNELRAVYLGMVSRFDHQFGLVCDSLKEHNLYQDTSIFVFSDHGDYTGDYGIVEKVQNCFEDPICNVPLLIKPASCFPVKTGKNPALVELVDLPATVAAMAGISLDYVQFGKSLLPVLKGETVHKDAVFCEGGRLHGETQAMEAGHGPEFPYWPRLDTQCQEGPEHTKACMIRMGNIKYVMRLYEEDELYDLEKDPMELENRIHDESYADIVLKMKLRMLQYYMETADWVPNRKDRR
jgi:arylsulfatase A-like enzyme